MTGPVGGAERGGPAGGGRRATEGGKPSPVARWAPWILGWVALALVVLYWTQVEADRTDERIAYHQAILSGTGESPYQYRVLGAWVAQGVVAALEPMVGYRRAFHVAYLLWNLAGAVALFLGQFLLLRRWFRAETALWVSLALVPGLLYSFGHPNYFYMPSSTVEPAFVVWILIWALDGRTAWVLGAVALASLNRETALVPALMAVAIWFPRSQGDGVAAVPDPHGIPTGTGTVQPTNGAGRDAAGSGTRWVRLAGPLVLWAVLYGSLRLAFGTRPAFYTLGEIFERNATFGALFFAAVHLTLFLGPLWWAAARGLGRAPAALRRASLTLPLAALLFLVFGIWREVRVLLMVMPLLVVLAAFGVVGPEGSRGGGRTGDDAG